MSDIPTITLNNGVAIPQMGFGVFMVKPAETRDTVLQAFEAGYRHIDTAQMYLNEQGVGQAIRDSGIPRDEIFVTSKLSNAKQDPADARDAFERSMEQLGLDSLDLFLIHWPMPQHDKYVGAWQVLEELYGAGRIRAIGVSNFHQPHLQRLFDETEVVPAVNQIEVSPYLTQDDLRAFCRQHRIAVEAWSPIARGKVVDDPVINGIGERLGKTAAQVTLRWHIQRGDIVFPKSVSPQRMAENIDIFDFVLTESDMQAISALDAEERTGPHPDEFHWMPDN